MSQDTSPGKPFWDRVVRTFHWTNLVLMLGLLILGTIILNSKALGVTNDAKVFLKTIHVWIGYAFVTNLLIRLAWAFRGKANSGWSSLFPSFKDIKAAFSEQLPNLFNARGHRYQGHSPLGKISIGLMLICMCLMAVSGLVLAGTDIFYPPLGHWVAQSIAAPGVDPSTLVPYRPEMLNEEAYQAMRAWRSPFIEIHEISYYVLLFLVPLHIMGVVIAELKTGDNLVSAMISGRRTRRSGEEQDVA